MSCAIISFENQGLNFNFCRFCYRRFFNESKNTLQVKDVSFESDHLESIELSNEKSGDTLI